MTMFGKSDDNSTSIGQVLKCLGFCTDQDLAHAADELNGAREVMLGETLVQMGVITSYQLDIALCKQKALRGKLTTKEALAAVDQAMDRSRSVFNGLGELGAMASAAAKHGGK